MMVAILQIIHLALVAGWVGAMGYSLLVVQPKVARFFTGAGGGGAGGAAGADAAPGADGAAGGAGDDARREELLITLADGNRWKVVPLIAALVATAVAVLLLADVPPVRVGFAVALVLYLVAAGIFANVSWRHWPARVFALPAELPGYRRRLTQQAWAMLLLAGTAFGATLISTVWWG